MNPWEHPLLGPGVALTDEAVSLLFGSLTLPQFQSMYDRVRMASLYQCGVRKLVFILSADQVRGGGAVNLLTDLTVNPTVNWRLDELGLIFQRWLQLEGTSACLIFCQGITPDGIDHIISNTDSGAIAVANYINAVWARFPASVVNHANMVWCWAAEIPASGLYGGNTEAKLAAFHHRLRTAITPAVYDSKMWMIPRTSWSSIFQLPLSDPATPALFGNPTDGFTNRRNTIVRAAFYEPFFLTHQGVVTRLQPFDVAGAAPNYPLTEARRLQMGTAASYTWAGGAATSEAVAAVGYGRQEMIRDLASVLAFERAVGLPVFIQEAGYRWNDAWGSAGARNAWFIDAANAAKAVGIENRICWFSSGYENPAASNFGMGATDTDNTVTVRTRAALTAVTGGAASYSQSQLASIEPPAFTDR